jgi:hypothetical protein
MIDALGEKHFTNMLACEFMFLFFETNSFADFTIAPLCWCYKTDTASARIPLFCADIKQCDAFAGDALPALARRHILERCWLHALFLAEVRLAFDLGAPSAASNELALFDLRDWNATLCVAQI